MSADAIFTSVDLSRLPVPAVIQQIDYETLLAGMLARLRALDPQFTALTEADPAYKILEVAAYYVMLERQRSNDSCHALMLAYAKGSDLDHLGALFGVSRKLLQAGNPAKDIPPVWEDDSELRRRIQLAPEGFSVAGPEGAYIFHALSADPDVLDASATSPSPGQVRVTVLSRHGTGAPTSQMLANVRARLNSDTVRPLTDQVTVQAAQITQYTVSAVVYTYAGPDSTLVLAESRRRLEKYIDESRRLGRDIPRSGIYSVLHTEGVQRVELQSPTEDITVSRTQAAHCTAIHILHGGVDE